MNSTIIDLQGVAINTNNITFVKKIDKQLSHNFEWLDHKSKFRFPHFFREYNAGFWDFAFNENESVFLGTDIDYCNNYADTRWWCNKMIFDIENKCVSCIGRIYSFYLSAGRTN